jgi:hypothetical protein
MKTGPRLLGISATVLVAAALAYPSAAAACSCGGVPDSDADPRDFFRGWKGAVVARLVSATPIPPNADGLSHYGFDYDYRIIRVFKDKTRVLRRRGHLRMRISGTCAPETTTGRNYGLFLDRRRGRWQTSTCATTSPDRMRRLARRADLAKVGCAAD